MGMARWYKRRTGVHHLPPDDQIRREDESIDLASLPSASLMGPSSRVQRLANLVGDGPLRPAERFGRIDASAGARRAPLMGRTDGSHPILHI
jgi:hypothetical protein